MEHDRQYRPSARAASSCVVHWNVFFTVPSLLRMHHRCRVPAETSRYRSELGVCEGRLPAGRDEVPRAGVSPAA
jgi:hypothetical protein